MENDAIGIGLSVLLIAYLCIQVYPFQEQKLEQGKYDGYGFGLFFGLDSLCIYLIMFCKKVNRNGSSKWEEPF